MPNPSNPLATWFWVGLCAIMIGYGLKIAFIPNERDISSQERIELADRINRISEDRARKCQETLDKVYNLSLDNASKPWAADFQKHYLGARNKCSE